VLRTVYAVAIDFIYALFIRELLLYLGLPEPLATFTAPSLVILSHVLSVLDFKILKRLYAHELSIPVVINVENKVLYKEVRIRRVGNTLVLINATGAVIPAVIACILLTRLVRNYLAINGYIMNYVIMATLVITVLTITVNRTYKVGNSYVGIPLLKTLSIAVILNSLVGMVFNAEVAFATSFTVTYISLLIGNEVHGIKKLLPSSSGVLSVGGAGVADALILLPMMSSLLSKYLVLLLNVLPT